MCTYFVLNKYYYIIILYGGSHASDILHVLMGVSVAKLIIYNIVLLFICHNKRSSSSSSTSMRSDNISAENRLLIAALTMSQMLSCGGKALPCMLPHRGPNYSR